MRRLVVCVLIALLTGCTTIPASVAPAPTVAPLPPTPSAPAASPLSQQLAAAMAQQCSGMTAPQILAAAEAITASFQQAGGNTSVEQLLYVTVSTPNLIANVQTCQGSLTSAAAAIGIVGGLPDATPAP